MSFLGWLGILIIGSVVLYGLIELKDWIDKDQQ
jgi:hypothetical protein